MKNEVFYSLIAAQEKFEAKDRKDLEQALVSGAFLRAAKEGLARAQQYTLSVAQTLPQPDKVIEIAHTQGRIAGMYELLDVICNLTEGEQDVEE